MTIKQLGKILREMYDNAPCEDKVANIHLFGIKYAKIIQHNYYSATEIVRESGIRPSYATEVSKGIRLSKYVTPIE